MLVQSKELQPNTGEDTRFVLPSEQTLPIVVPQQHQQQQQVKSSGSGDVAYPETNFLNSTSNEGFTQPNSDEHELETRLK